MLDPGLSLYVFTLYMVDGCMYLISNLTLILSMQKRNWTVKALVYVLEKEKKFGVNYVSS
jgi:hypothetical protein